MSILDDLLRVKHQAASENDSFFSRECLHPGCPACFSDHLPLSISLAAPLQDKSTVMRKRPELFPFMRETMLCKGSPYLVVGMEQALELGGPGLPALRGVAHVVEGGRPALQQRAGHQRLQLGRARGALRPIVLRAQPERKVQPLLVLAHQLLQTGLSDQMDSCWS